MISKVILLVLFCGSCGVGTANLQSRRSADLEVRAIRRIAVMPASSIASQKAKIPFTAPVGEPRASERDAPELLARMLYASMAGLANWQIVSENEVREVDSASAPTTATARLKLVGEMVYADAVMTSTVQRFRERVGDDWGAKSPASVAFTLELVDVRRGDIVWSARYDETQKSLSENIFALGAISTRGLRWLTADELTQDAVRKAVGELHQIIARTPAP